MKSSLFLAALLLPLPAAAQAPHARHQHAQPYAALVERDIRALSPEQMEDLRLGRGMTLALAAELNGWPSPAHVLEHADDLHLTPEQRGAATALMEAHRARAMALGQEIITAERALDQAFRNRSITPGSLDGYTTRIASLQGALRTEHLRTHLDQTALLRPEQMARYDVVRGYAAPSTHDHMRGGHRR